MNIEKMCLIGSIFWGAKIGFLISIVAIQY
jgi:hypothetical protein